MDDATLVDVAISNPADPNQPLHIVQATVTAVSPTTGTATLQFGSSSSVAGIPYLNGVPGVNDKVLVLETGGTQCIIGVVANPAGTGQTGMISYTRSSSAPTGWAFCNGGAINSAYTALIALCGANTPDLRDRLIIGAGSTYALAATGGSATSTALLAHTHTQDAHTHTQNSHNHTQDAHAHGQQLGNGAGGSTTVQIGTFAYPASAGSTANATATNQSATATNQNATATNQSTGSGSSFSILNPYYALNPIIRAL